MGKILKLLGTTFKAKIVPIWTKIKLFFSKTFLQAKFITVLRSFFSKLFNVKPRDKKDYFTTRRWMISRRLAYLLVIVLGMLSVYLIFVIAKPFGSKSSSGNLKTYRYNSVILKFLDSDVKIKAKSGYIAYVGHVKQGEASGDGTLYNEAGSKIYEGAFSGSKYNGTGTLYYNSGQAKYVGEFKDNVYNGTGTFYRPNGSKEYSGEYVDGKRQGQGTLLNLGNNVIFTGEFNNDEIAYNQLLGKKPSEISSGMYTGKNLLYQYGDTSIIDMSEIDTYYINNNSSTSIDDENAIEEIFVVKNQFAYGNETIDSTNALIENFGTPEYEGNTYLTFEEAVGIHELEEDDNENLGGLSSELKYTSTYDEVRKVTSFDANAELYIYEYTIDDISYTFYFNAKYGNMLMYSMAIYE